MNRFRLLAVLLLSASSFGAAESIAAEPSVSLMQRILKAADKSHDGKLSVEEYKTLDVQAKHHGDEHFQAGDKNNDGFIDATELADALKKQTWFAILSEGTEVCFQRLDVNKDARLDAAEYRKVSKMGGHSEQHFNGADANKDGFLDLTEFTAHAEHKLTALESDQPRKKRSKK
jgi:Ca2+-binding EF-hand superfamily protein